MKKVIVLLLFFIIDFPNSLIAQDTINKISLFTPAPSFNKKRLRQVEWAAGTAYIASMTGLYSLWYQDYPLKHFHFFDDNDEWLLLDKGGHLASSYIVGKAGIEVLKWTGMEKKKAIWYGGNAGLAFLTSIEIFDGFSDGWGFSVGDFAANVTGPLILIPQELGWDEQRIQLKFSYHPTEFAQYRPDQLGAAFSERFFKDYNGHTYWLSGNIGSFLSKESRFPKWLSFAVGYGADGMTGAEKNITEYHGKPVPHFNRHQQFYFAPDIDLTKIKTKSAFLKTLFGALNFLKFPLPALEYNKDDKFVFHAVYF